MGNVGVEHASHKSILAALHTALGKQWGGSSRWATEALLTQLQLSSAFDEQDRELVRVS